MYSKEESGFRKVRESLEESFGENAKLILLVVDYHPLPNLICK